MSDTYNYELFGGCLNSDVALPALRRVEPRTPTWRLRTSTEPATLREADVVGDHEIPPDIRIRVYRHARGFSVDYNVTGTFDISSDGSAIVWHPAPDAPIELVRDCIIGRVLSTALHAAKMLCLHGSAVALAEGGVGFLAPQFHGKSTLALALAAAGGRLITDDTVLVDPKYPVTVWPGVHSARLFGDSREKLHGVVSGVSGDENPFREKAVIADLPEHQLMFERTPLAALYLLAPVPAGSLGDAAARRTRRSGVDAAVWLARHLKVGHVLGDAESALLFDRAIDVVRCVPVYTLEVVRDFDRLGDVVSQVMGWHGHTLAAQAAE